MGLFDECKIWCCFVREKAVYSDSEDDSLLKKNLAQHGSQIRAFSSCPPAPPPSPADAYKESKVHNQATLSLPVAPRKGVKLKML